MGSEAPGEFEGRSEWRGQGRPGIHQSCRKAPFSLAFSEILEPDYPVVNAKSLR